MSYVTEEVYESVSKRLHDLLCALVDDLMVIGLEANANHFFCHFRFLLHCCTVFSLVVEAVR